jgi:hypothetical protein
MRTLIVGIGALGGLTIDGLEPAWSASAAEIAEGVPDHVVRAVTENGRTLKFTSNSGFEKE